MRALQWFGFLLCAQAVMAQPPTDPSLRFEVASMKLNSTPSGPGFIRGGPGTNMPGQLTCTRTALGTLITRAYGLNGQQFEMNLGSPYYDIIAKIPSAATTRDQVSMMLRNLLIERLKLASHFEPKEVNGFVLSAAKGGSKVAAAAPESLPDGTTQPVSPPRKQSDGTLAAPRVKGQVTYTASADGDITLLSTGATIAQLVKMLPAFLGGPVEDQSGLTGRYDYTITFSSAVFMGAHDPGTYPDIVSVLQKQLGLQVTRRKTLIQVFVIDHVEKTPAGN